MYDASYMRILHRKPFGPAVVLPAPSAEPVAGAMPPANKKAKRAPAKVSIVDIRETASWACKFRNLLNYRKSEACKKASHVPMHIYTPILTHIPHMYAHTHIPL